MRRVVLLCGPPGAGKSTAAAASGLLVFDRDHPQWTSEAQFRSAIAELATTSTARAVVIRSGATSSARAAAARLIGATHVFLFLEPLAVLERRIRARGRADMVPTLVAARTWLARFDRIDGVRDFPGWAHLDAPVSVAGFTTEDW